MDVSSHKLMASPINDVVKFIATRKRQDEDVVAWASAYQGKMFGGEWKDRQRNGALIVTNKRALFYLKGWISEILEEIPLDKIASVEQRKTLLVHTVSIHTSGNSLEVKSTDGDRLSIVIAEIEARKGSQATPAISSSDRIVQLERLARLKADGVLTAEEFEREKARLLSA